MVGVLRHGASITCLPNPLSFLGMSQKILDLIQHFLAVPVCNYFCARDKKFSQFVRVASAIECPTHRSFELTKMQVPQHDPAGIMSVVHFQETEADLTLAV